MYWKAVVLIAVLMTPVAAAQAQEVWIGRPTIGDHIRRDFTKVMQAQQDVVRSKAEFNAEIADARRDFLATASNPAARAAVEKRFADLLFAKDLLYATMFIAEGFTEQSRLRSEGLHLLTGGPMDNGIPEDGQAAFATWVNGIRASLGATRSNQVLFLSAADSDRLRQALVENEPLYRKYKVLRDQQELNGGLSQREIASRKEAVRVQESVNAARTSDGSAQLFKEEVKLFSVGDLPFGIASERPLRLRLIKVREAGQQALHCMYGPSMTSDGEESYTTYTFWYRSPPANIDSLMQDDGKGFLKYIGSQGLEGCPSSDKAALAIEQAAVAAHPFSH